MSDSGEPSGDIDWNLIEDFDSVEGAHSRPRWEYAFQLDGQMVVFKETDPITRNENYHNIPTSVVAAVDTDVGQDGDSA